MWDPHTGGGLYIPHIPHPYMYTEGALDIWYLLIRFSTRFNVFPRELCGGGSVSWLYGTKFPVPEKPYIQGPLCSIDKCHMHVYYTYSSIPRISGCKPDPLQSGTSVDVHPWVAPSVGCPPVGATTIGAHTWVPPLLGAHPWVMK